MIMKLLTVVTLLVVGFLQVFGEDSKTSITPPGEGFETTQEELIKRSSMLEDDDDDDDDEHLMMYRRAKSSGSDYSTKDSKKLITAHNNWRKGVAPESNDMNELLWNSKLAAQAQAWSDGCYYEHPSKTEHPDYVGIGQNLYIKYLDKGGNSPPPVAEPVNLWYGEVKDFSYPMNQCLPGAVCGHFTQVVWAETTKVGCGIKFCPLATSTYKNFENAWLVTCNYSPAGNMRGEKPYVAGDRCGACAKGFCKKDLCSKCKFGEKGCECNLECQNCGTLNSKKCKCTCPAGFYGAACEGECRDKHPNCGGNPGWPSFWCGNPSFPFVSDLCPKLCGACEGGDGSSPSC